MDNDEEIDNVPPFIKQLARVLTALMFAGIAVGLIGLVIMAFKFCLWALEWTP